MPFSKKNMTFVLPPPPDRLPFKPRQFSSKHADGSPSKREKKDGKRGFVIKEILSTEENYISVLSHFLDCYQLPLDDILTVKKDRIIFGVIPKLIEIHQQFATKLKKMIENEIEKEKEKEKEGDDNCMIGNLLLEWVPKFEIYETYAQTLSEAQSLVKSLFIENKVFADVVECCATGEVYVGYRGFLSLLMTPIQRVMRYIILCEALLKATPDKHADYLPTANALEKFSFLVDHINYLKFNSDQILRTKEIEKKLIGNLNLFRSCASLDDEITLQHDFSPNSKITLVYCDFCQKIIIKEGMECLNCFIQIHTKCKSEISAACGPIKRPKLLSDTRTLLGDWEEIGHRIFHDATHQPYVPSSLFVFSDGLLVTRKNGEGEKYEVIAMIRWYSKHANAWTDVQMVNVTEKKVAFVKITPANHRKEFHEIRFDDPSVGNIFMETVKGAIEKKKEQMGVWNSFLPQRSRLPTISHLAHERLYEFTIPETVSVRSGSSKNGFFTAYVLHVTRVDGKKMTLLKRYNQFYELHTKLVKHYGQSAVDEVCRLPRKHFFKNDPILIQKRCAKLSFFLNDLNQLPLVWTLPFVRQFFEESVEDGEDEALKVTRALTSSDRKEGNEVTSNEKKEETKAIEKREREETLVVEDELKPLMPLPVEMAKVEYDYNAQSDRELSIKMGEEISILSKDNEDWWFAKKDSKVGYVPASYVKSI
jgi:hypothetical protein